MSNDYFLPFFHRKKLREYHLLKLLPLSESWPRRSTRLWEGLSLCQSHPVHVKHASLQTCTLHLCLLTLLLSMSLNTCVKYCTCSGGLYTAAVRHGPPELSASQGCAGDTNINSTGQPPSPAPPRKLSAAVSSVRLIHLYRLFLFPPQIFESQKQWILFSEGSTYPDIVSFHLGSSLLEGHLVAYFFISLLLSEIFHKR